MITSRVAFQHARTTIVVCFSLLLVACEGRVTSDLPVVVVTIPPQAFLIERMAAGLVEVRTMVADGQSPEDYQPLPQQLAAMNGATYYFSIGMPFESLWLPKMLDAQPETKIVAMHAGLGSDSGDPHYWTDPRKAIVLANNAYARLQTILPGSEQLLRNNHADLIEELQRLDAKIEALIAQQANNRFLVYHPAWSHFAARYGLQQIAFEHDGKQPGARFLAELLALGRKNNVQTILVQPQSSIEHARRLARELDARVVSVDPLGYDYPENLWEVAQAITGALW
ncbi:MAG: zinc ABC transporter substrate-binding protein [Gammaproteobacteria bacterium]|nr:zinc ABC transporter substrate-binding protein [Gammaproteobacteria bacterium]